jgi:DEAD/DEAH box helicase domain-containing protein
MELLADSAPEPVVQEIRAQLDHGLIGNLQSGPIQLFVFARKKALQSADPHGLRIVCCLDDQDEAQEKPGFERSWINYLRLFNIFQFLPHTVFVTTLGLRQNIYADLELAFSDQNSAQGSASPSEDDPAWQEAFDLAHPKAHEVIEAMRREGWPAPEVGFDITVNDRVIATAELAWPEEKVAYVWSGQEDELEGIESAGWEIRAIGGNE